MLNFSYHLVSSYLESPTQWKKKEDRKGRMEDKKSKEKKKENVRNKSLIQLPGEITRYTENLFFTCQSYQCSYKFKGFHPEV